MGSIILPLSSRLSCSPSEIRDAALKALGQLEALDEDKLVAEVFIVITRGGVDVRLKIHDHPTPADVCRDFWTRRENNLKFVLDEVACWARKAMFEGFFRRSPLPILDTTSYVERSDGAPNKAFTAQEARVLLSAFPVVDWRVVWDKNPDLHTMHGVP